MLGVPSLLERSGSSFLSKNETATESSSMKATDLCQEVIGAHVSVSLRDHAA